MSILQKILEEKEKEVIKLKLADQALDQPNKEVPTFKEIVHASDTINIIAEIKRSSPSKGAIDLEVDPVEQAKTYSKHGASAISVLTDQPFFNGSMDDLRAVREAVDIPILCKDFIIDPLQIDQAKAAGANIILLIVAALSDDNLRRLYNYAKSLQLEVLVEVHNEEEMKRALHLEPELLGINNRDLNTFHVSLETTEKLASLVTNPDTIIVSESGMKTNNDVTRARNAGAKAILVGETLMQSDHLETTFKELKVPRRRSGVK